MCDNLPHPTRPPPFSCCMTCATFKDLDRRYDAKVVKVDASRGAECYLIHYTGWNSRHDAWLPIDRTFDSSVLGHLY